MTNLTQEQIQTKAAEFSAECPWYGLRKAVRVTTQLFDEMMAPSGIRITQLSVLAEIAQARNITVTNLAGNLVMDQTTLSRNLDPLIRDGLVRKQKGEDKRTREVVLTGQGEKVLAKALPLWSEAKETVINLIGQEKFNLILDAVGQLVTEFRE